MKTPDQVLKQLRIAGLHPRVILNRKRKGDFTFKGGSLERQQKQQGNDEINRRGTNRSKAQCEIYIW